MKFGPILFLYSDSRYFRERDNSNAHFFFQVAIQYNWVTSSSSHFFFFTVSSFFSFLLFCLILWWKAKVLDGTYITVQYRIEQNHTRNTELRHNSKIR